MINGMNGKQTASPMNATVIEIRRLTICCEALTLKPCVKMRVLGLSPSSGSLPKSRSISVLASSVTTPFSRRSRSSRTGIDPRRFSMATMTRSMPAFGARNARRSAAKRSRSLSEFSGGFPFDHFHSGIAPCSQNFDNMTRSHAATENVDSFLERRKAHDPFIDSSP